jgi:hypothetical protein
MIRTKRWILGGAVLTVLMAALVTWWAFHVRDRPVQPDARHGVAASASAPDESAQADAVNTLIGRLPEAFASGDDTLLSTAARERGIDLDKALPAGSRLTMDRATWRRTGAVGSATVTMTVAGHAPAHFVVVVINEKGVWRVSSTYPAGVE